MQITVFMENAPRPGFKAEHGLSLLLETQGRTILFDFGQSGAFARNAGVLGLDLNRIDLAILSHGHYDHGGGIREFLALNDHAPIYLSRHCFRDYRHGSKYIGLDPALSEEKRLHHVDGDLSLGSGLTIRCCENRPKTVPPEQDGLLAGSDWDDFRHEICLEITDSERTVLISGCSHNGVENLLSWFSPQVFVGGFHSRNMDIASPEFSRLASALAGSEALFYTGHCTGRVQFDALKQSLKNRVHYLYTGERYRI